MAKYELMLLIDPKEADNKSEKLASEIFKNFKGNTLERTELAYEINKSTTGKYVVAEVEATGAEVAEFRRKANILKTLWRYQIVNLDKEIGRAEAPAKMARHAKKVAEKTAERKAIREARIAAREAAYAKRRSAEEAK